MKWKKMNNIPVGQLHYCVNSSRIVDLGHVQPHPQMSEHIYSQIWCYQNIRPIANRYHLLVACLANSHMYTYWSSLLNWHIRIEGEGRKERMKEKMRIRRCYTYDSPTNLMRSCLKNKNKNKNVSYLHYMHEQLNVQRRHWLGRRRMPFHDNLSNENEENV